MKIRKLNLKSKFEFFLLQSKSHLYSLIYSKTPIKIDHSDFIEKKPLTKVYSQKNYYQVQG